MEIYTGIKFVCTNMGPIFPYDERLTVLNTWAHILAELGLTPIHSAGAYGNQSYRAGTQSMIITKSGMVPEQNLRVENYVLIEDFDQFSGKFKTWGVGDPSSESILHAAIYTHSPGTGAILHGHSKLLEQFAKQLGIRVTPDFHPYGTAALADSAVQLLTDGDSLIILKNHGFVAVGNDIATAGKLVLTFFGKLIDLMKSA